MAINFPNTPADGDTHVVGAVTFTYSATKTVWSPSSGGSSGGGLTAETQTQIDDNELFSLIGL